MVSWDTRISGSLGYCTGNHLAIWAGDHFFLSLASTTVRSRALLASLATLGRRARSRAPASASQARYLPRPPLAPTSLEIVEGALRSTPAITRHDSPAASPREISSRSARHRRLSDHTVGVSGRMPPVFLT